MRVALTTFHVGLAQMGGVHSMGVKGLQINDTASCSYKLYLVQEYCNTSLAAALYKGTFHVKSQPCMDLICCLLTDVAHGMCYIHRRQIIHVRAYVGGGAARACGGGALWGWVERGGGGPSSMPLPWRAEHCDLLFVLCPIECAVPHTVMHDSECSAKELVLELMEPPAPPFLPLLPSADPSLPRPSPSPPPLLPSPSPHPFPSSPPALPPTQNPEPLASPPLHRPSPPADPSPRTPCPSPLPPPQADLKPDNILLKVVAKDPRHPWPGPETVLGKVTGGWPVAEGAWGGKGSCVYNQAGRHEVSQVALLAVHPGSPTCCVFLMGGGAVGRLKGFHRICPKVGCSMGSWAPLNQFHAAGVACAVCLCGSRPVDGVTQQAMNRGAGLRGICGPLAYNGAGPLEAPIAPVACS